MNSGRHYLFTTDFVNTGLKVGENTVTLQLTGSGSKDGIMYDCIKLEAGDLVTSGIGDVRESMVATPRPYKYIVNGRLVIEKSGRCYSLTGALLK